MEELHIDCEKVTRTIEEFLSEYLQGAGFTKGILGLSGGLDSSTCAYLATRALGPENLTGVMMPYKTSDPASEADARLVADALGLNVLRIDLTPQVDAYFEKFPEADRLRRANKMARERMTILYDQSAALGALVIGAGNKTEALLGYTTLWGDMACAVVPLGDLYKTQVRQLSRWLGVPEQIVEKSPSADLWPGQTDEGELGLTYAEADQILYRLIDLGRQPEEIMAEGFAEEVVRRVIGKIRSSQFKRRMPLVARLSPASADLASYSPPDWEK